MAPTLDGGNATGTPTQTTLVPLTAEIIGLVEQQVQDVTGDMYPPSDLLPYLNLAVAKIVEVDPQAYPVTRNFSLVAGARQTLGTAEISIMDVICNVTGTTTGNTVTILPRKSLDALLPTWQNFTANVTVRHVIRDDFDPYTFYVFPPQLPGTAQKLSMIFSELPPELADVGDTFPLEASYKIACIDYMLYLVLHEETTIPNALKKADQCLAEFYRDMGVEQPQAKQGGG